MNQSYLIGIDIGTSACKVALFDRSGCVLAAANGDYPVYYPKEGLGRAEPGRMVECCSRGAVRQVIEEASVAPEEIAGVGIDGQSWSAIAIDRNGHASDQYTDLDGHKSAVYLRPSQRGNRCRGNL